MHGGQKSAFLEWKNPPTGFSKLLHLFPDWLCSPDSYFFLNFFFLLYHLSTRGTQQCSQAHESEEEMAKSGCPLKLLKNWQEKKQGRMGSVCLSLTKQTYIFALFKARFHPSILCCFEQICPVTWHNIKAINLRRSRSKRRPQRLVIMKKRKSSQR